jgi:hypothetical protein
VTPLDLPWARGRPPEPEKAKVPNFIGLKNQVVRDDAEAGGKKITIEVKGVKGHQPGEYEIAFEEGATLGHYLKRLKLRRAAAYSAVRDFTNLPAGRLRLSYVPKEGAKIVLGSASVSSAIQYQRSNIDAQRVAYNMGAINRSAPPKVVEVPVRKSRK